MLRIANAGLVIIGYSSKPSQIVLPAQKFNDYLMEEGLESVAARRSKRNETNAEAREALPAAPRRCFRPDRSLPRMSTARSASRSNSSPRRTPTVFRPDTHPGSTVETRTSLLPGHSSSRSTGATLSVKVSARSGKDGRVTLKLAEPGMRLVKA